MEQKDYRLEIVNILANGENHIRGIANLLNVNHMTILRKIKELVRNNVLDMKVVGRNKTYFLKRSVEARSFVIMAEQYSLINLLRRHVFLRDIVSKIQRNKKIKLALIFGSYAKKLERKNSDIDIFIESQDLKLKKEYSLLDSKISIKIGKMNLKNNLVKEICKNHVLIKGGEIYYEKFFG